jgi:hypothetical protein
VPSLQHDLCIPVLHRLGVCLLFSGNFALVFYLYMHCA